MSCLGGFLHKPWVWPSKSQDIYDRQTFLIHCRSKTGFGRDYSIDCVVVAVADVPVLASCCWYWCCVCVFVGTNFSRIRFVSPRYLIANRCTPHAEPGAWRRVRYNLPTLRAAAAER